MAAITLSFAVTIEDEEKPPLGERVQAALDVARELARYGGLMNVLIHPDITGHKLQFERDFITALKPVAWFGTVNDFATWSATHSRVQTSIIVKTRIVRPPLSTSCMKSIAHR